MYNILTIDLEDWYQGIEIASCQWSKYEDRVERSTQLLLGMLDDGGMKATFFILGYIAEKFPRLVREIAGLGHEIGTHGYGHELVYKLNPTLFASDLRWSIDCLEQTIGNSITSYRAPYFSITAESMWAMEILVEHGIQRDSSIFPVSNYRYGVPNAPRYLNRIETQCGPILEIPVSTVRMLGRNMPLTGGFYLRFFPYCLIKWAIQRINDEGYPAVVYLHPWELDPGHPRLSLPLRIRLTHYHNLTSTEGKLRALLQDFDFGTTVDIVKGENCLQTYTDCVTQFSD